MLLEKIKTPGLAHLSYLVGAGDAAAVIDPRRDCQIYIDKARAQGLEITHIFETHRNEDLISGAPILSARTGATVYHGPNAEGDVQYAQIVREGESFEIGSLRIEVLETPGHTYDHVAYTFYDMEYPDGAVGVFTGDALFVGDVGRTDFYPDRAEEVAGMLFDSLEKILALGDQPIIYPAHGAGSVCGSGMADREISTVGHERKNNPRLNMASREAFVEAKLNETHYVPPYFSLMERLNLEGAQEIGRGDSPKMLTLEQLEQCKADHIIDIRSPAAFSVAHFPQSYLIPASMLPAFAGWFVSEGESIAFVADNEEQLEEALAHMRRIGLDSVLGGYTGIVSAAAKGRSLESIAMVDTATVERRLQDGQSDWLLLDVRAQDEIEEFSIDNTEHVYLGHLNREWKNLDKDKHHTMMCASGMRASIGAGWLKSKGFEKVDIYLGSIGAWKAAHG